MNMIQGGRTIAVLLLLGKSYMTFDASIYKYEWWKLVSLDHMWHNDNDDMIVF
jgi:hypothetical protein